MTGPKQAAVADLEEWVIAHRETFESVAQASGTPRDLVHIAAVFVKSGLTDQQILQECEAVAPRYGALEAVQAGVTRLLPLLRASIEDSPDSHRDEP